MTMGPVEEVSKEVLESYGDRQLMPVSFTNEAYNFSKYLLEDDDIPEDIKKYFWAFCDKEIALTKLDSREIRRLLGEFDDAVIAYLMSIPEWEHSFESELLLSQMRAKLKMKLNRSHDGFQGKLLSTQIRQIIYSEDEMGQPKPGLLGRFLGKR